MRELHHERRAFLGTATAVVTGSLVRRLDIQENSDALTTVNEERSPSNPLTYEEIRALQDEAIEEHRNRTGATEPIGKSSFNIDSDSPVISFVYMIDGSNRSRYYIGQAQDTPTEESRPRYSAGYRGQVSDFKKQQTTTTTEATTEIEETTIEEEVVETTPEDEERVLQKQAVHPPSLPNIRSVSSTYLREARESGSVVSGLYQLNEPANTEITGNYITGGTTDTAIEPYGRVISSIEVYRLGRDIERVFYAVRQNLTIVPGMNQYPDADQKWRTKSAIAEHHWEQNTFDSDVLLLGHEPSGYHDGEEHIEVQIGFSDQSLGWTYNQPVVERSNNSAGKIARWKWKWPSSQVRENTATFELGSLVGAWQRPTTGDRIVSIQSQVTSRKRRSPPQEHSVPGSLIIDYG